LILFKFLHINHLPLKMEASARIISTALEAIQNTIENSESFKTLIAEKLEPGNVFYQVIIDQIDDIVSSLKHSVEEGSIFMTTYGREEIRLGTHNIALVEMIHYCLKTFDKSIAMTIAMSNFLTICIVSLF